MLILSVSAPWLGAVFGRAWPGFIGGDFGRLHEMSFRDASIASLLEMLWHESVADDPPARLFLESGTLSLATLLLRRSGLACDVRRDERRSSQRLRRAMDCIEDRLSEDLALAEIAAAASASPRGLLRLFRDGTGRTPYAYLQYRRIERAKELLKGDGTLAGIAYACGFSSQSHFGQVFRRETGTSPAAWRRARE
jgi:AraC family transcriptional regulator